MKWKSQTHSAFGKFSNLEKFPGITTLFLKLAEDDNLTGLQTITKKAFHMLISKRTTKHCGTICCSKISSLGKLFLFLVQMLKIFELTLFFSAHRLTTWMDYKPLSSFEHMIWQYGNLAIWQSGNLLSVLGEKKWGPRVLLRVSTHYYQHPPTINDGAVKQKTKMGDGRRDPKGH